MLPISACACAHHDRAETEHPLRGSFDSCLSKRIQRMVSAGSYLARAPFGALMQPDIVEYGLRYGVPIAQNLLQRTLPVPEPRKCQMGKGPDHGFRRGLVLLDGHLILLERSLGNLLRRILVSGYAT